MGRAGASPLAGEGGVGSGLSKEPLWPRGRCSSNEDVRETLRSMMSNALVRYGISLVK